MTTLQKNWKIIAFVLFLATIILPISVAISDEQTPTMDQKSFYNPSEDSIEIEWFPSLDSKASRFEIRCYNSSDIIVQKYSASEQERSLIISGIQKLGITEIEVISFDKNNNQIEASPCEQINTNPIQQSELNALASDTGQLDISLVSCDSQNFPFIYMTARLNRDGQAVSDLIKSNFSVTEDGKIQTDFFEVTPPQTSGGVRMADIVFLIDNSGSMSTEIAAVRNNCVAFANALETSNISYRLGLVRFGQSTNGGNPSIIGGGLTDNAETFKSWVGTMQANGGTEPGFWAIRLAIQSFNFRPSSQKVFILITDEDADEPRDKAGTINLIQTNQVTVHSAVDCSFGTANADYCGTGSVRDVSGGLQFSVTGDYRSILNTISGSVANTYIIRYRTDNPVLNGVQREVICTVDDGASSDFFICYYIPGGAPIIKRTADTIALHNDSLVDGSSPTISVTVTDSAEPFVQSVTLYVRQTGSASYTTVNMINQGGNLYSAQAPSSCVQTPGLDYYIRATDGQVSSSSPTTDPEIKPYQIAVLPNIAPEIQHTPPEYCIAGRDCDLTVRAIDTTYHLKKIWIYYRTKGELLYQGVGSDYPEGTTDVTETFTCNKAQFTSPAVEYYIEATDNLGVKRNWPEGGASQPYELTVREPLRGSVFATTGWLIFSESHSLPYVQVSLIQEDGSFYDTVIADANGQFEFPGQNSGNIPNGKYKLNCILWYKPEWAEQNDWIFRVMHDDSDVIISSKNSFILNFNNSSPSVKDIDFADTSNYEAFITNPERTVDLAVTYCYTAAFCQFIKDNLGSHIPQLDLPLEIHSFASKGPDGNPVGGAYYWYEEVWIDPSQYPSANRPMNCEWHETAHYLMEDAHGHLGKRHNGDDNHDGFNNHCTGDSWSEGWAEFWPCALNFTRGDNDWHQYANFGSLEVNRRVWDNGGTREEFAVAGVLIDLIDNDDHDNHENNTDFIQIGIGELWSIIGTNKNLNDFKDVYDALSTANIGQGDSDNDGITDLDEIFITHGFFVDTQSSGQAGYRIWNNGEEIGRAADAVRPNRRNTPYISRAYVLTNVVTSNGFPTNLGYVKIEVRYDSPWEGYNYDMKRRIDLLPEGMTYIEPEPDAYNPKIRMYIQDENGYTSDILEFTMERYKYLLSKNAGPYVVSHTFTIGSNETVEIDDLFIDPLSSDSMWMKAYIELEPNESPSNISLNDVQILYIKGKKLSSPIIADNNLAEPLITTDKDGDGIAELFVKFQKNQIISALNPMENLMSITIKWTDSNSNSHEGTAFIEGKEPVAINNLVRLNTDTISYDRRSGQTSLNVSVTALSEINTPLWLVIDSISNPLVTLVGEDGTTSDGKPYFNLSGLLDDGKLSPAETVIKRVYFNNPDRVQFSFTPGVRGVIEP